MSAHRRLSTLVRHTSWPTSPATVAVAASAATEKRMPTSVEHAPRRHPWLSDGLTDAQLEFFHANGYVVVPQCASPHQVNRLRRSCWDQLGMDPSDTDGWYRQQRPTPFHHFVSFSCPAGVDRLDSDQAAAWEIAQNPRVHSAFASLYGTDQLYCTVGQATVKPPWRADLPKLEHICHEGMRKWFSLGDALPMHWDYDMSLFETGTRHKSRARVELQANIFLNDRDETGGATCVNAGFLQHYEAWVTSTDGRAEIHRMKTVGKQHPDMSNVPGKRVNVCGKAGGEEQSAERFCLASIAQLIPLLVVPCCRRSINMGPSHPTWIQHQHVA